MYPIWEVPVLTSGMLLGLIAAFHVIPSHLSVSAMWFNIFVETKAYRENKPELLVFIKKYTLGLLIFAYIFGTLSGVGIWFSATVANPRGISALIHTYVWGWATEWVFFVIEVLAIYVYYYTFDKVDSRTHLKIGWIFALASWVTMIIIVGILSYMLSPGKFMETGQFFDGFFNTTYWSQLFMRTSFMFSISAVYAIIIANRLENKEVRTLITRWASYLGLGSLIVGSGMAYWYLYSLPAVAYHRLQLDILVAPALKITVFVSFGLLLLYFIYTLVKPLKLRLTPAILALVVLFAGVLAGERIREILRKPYVISDYMYSNQIISNDIPAKSVQAEVARLNAEGFLKSAAFVPETLRQPDENNALAAGHLLAQMQCTACHALEQNGLRAMPKMVERLQLKDVDITSGYLTGLGYYDFMPPFVGNAAERHALATYLVSLSTE